ncbi:magnesium-dependent phosphatase-1 [Pseudohyphozyma bogoriensis]|nr:magnesium-dependent phosphatase-1 [Pseudohyphozyma bogoriensis]
MTSESAPLKGRLPRAVVFDVDLTCWPVWVDTHVDPPLKRKGNDVNLIYDRYGQSLSFYPDVPKILMDLHHSGVHLGAASRTGDPKAMRQGLTEMLIPGSKRPPTKPNALKPFVPSETTSAITMFDSLEIYPGSKLTHFKEIHKKTGIPYEEMLFFDDESRNREVTKLGVHFVLVGNSGVTRKLFEQGLEQWRTARGE